jgi:hypothetical protein
MVESGNERREHGTRRAEVAPRRAGAVVPSAVRSGHGPPAAVSRAAPLADATRPAHPPPSSAGSAGVSCTRPRYRPRAQIRGKNLDHLTSARVHLQKQPNSAVYCQMRTVTVTHSRSEDSLRQKAPSQRPHSKAPSRMLVWNPVELCLASCCRQVSLCAGLRLLPSRWPRHSKAARAPQAYYLT